MSDLLDRLGDWSQIKHEILEQYAHAYTTIIKKKASIKKVLYIDAYAGSGYGVDRDTGAQLRGSALRAMQVQPPFDELHLVEEDPAKAAVLEQTTRDDLRATVHRGDGIETLRSELLPKCLYRDYRRALCLLDPYDLSVPWTLVQEIATMESVEIFYNFMIMDANRNVLWRDAESVPEERRAKMDIVWGDRSWRQEFYREDQNLFGDFKLEKLPNAAIAEAFRRRLESVAGFAFVPTPVAMRNSNNATVYYLYFASHNKVGGRIVGDIFRKYARLR